ncbi:MAG: dihydrofolate reductase family protein [Actinobacteria bacterium]|nr:dihydrofolate reductase family protein [Actinomycetota bacterium]
MAKLLYSATCSLDGFIAGPGGDMQWLNRLEGGNAAADELVPRIGALLVGANTHGGDDPNRGTDAEGAFAGQWHGPEFVVTHHPGTDRPPHLFYLDDLPRAIAAAREAAGERYVNVLGADVARQCIELGELDEILMLVAPVLLGDGVPMFRRSGGAEVRLEPLSATVEPSATNLWFGLNRPAGAPASE